ncbi:hemin storage protein [Lysobacter maris]|uniref:Hemin storage protein n=2 Tax=Marilutibacter maris TaxID=1605891 RepID=A0A2U9TDF7_9GAMM|nr:hemin storage protein [Lysobacter maris]
MNMDRPHTLARGIAPVFILIVSAALLLLLGLRPAAANELLVISYHDIRDDVARKGDPDLYAVGTQNFAAHLDWLAGHGYRPVSLGDVIAAADGTRPLPEKAVLLTFDDGLRSVYTHAFPLLRAYGYPALVAVVTDWIDMPPERRIDYGPRMFSRDDFLTWEQLREMQASGLVEIASHSHDLHHGVNSNPQGNSTPAAVTRIHDPASGRYESEREYLARVRGDLATSVSLIERELGRAPRAMVWPYAAYNSQVNRIADTLGMTVTFDLEGRNQPIVAGMNGDGLHGLARLLLFDNPGVDDLAYELRHDQTLEGMRALQIDLDYVYDTDPAQSARNLDRLIERVKRIGPSHVYLQAFADPDGNGSADALYFPNRHLPMRADLFNRVAWQLRTRAGVEVFAWLPVLGYELPDPALRESLAIASSNPAETFRLDPFKPQTRKIVSEIYEDLAASAIFSGLLFHDDALLRDDELTGRAPADPAARTRALIDFTHALRDAAGKWRPKLLTARNLFAATVLQPESEAWFAQRLDAFHAAYDYTAVMAMPWMEGSTRPEAWLDRLTDEVMRHPLGAERTVFELQTVDWRNGQAIPADRLKSQIRHLQARGVRHLAWYPDNFIDDVPALDDAREAMSARSFPYMEP